MKKTKTPILRIIIFLSFISFFQKINAQIYVNRESREEYGDPVFNPLLAPFGVDWSKSYYSPTTGELFTIGHTAVSGQGENILLTKFDVYGSLVWSVDYNSTSTDNDYGIDVVENPSTGDLYVCGVSDNGGSTDYDMLILVFNSSGVLQYSTRYNGPDSKNDIPTKISMDSGGSQILLLGTSEYTSTSYDLIALAYDLTLSTLNWNYLYDYTSLYDVGAQFVVLGGKMTIAGASANSATDWDYVTIDLDETTGSPFGSPNRINYPGYGYDEIYGISKHVSGMTVLTGKCSSNGTDYDIRLVMIDNNNQLVFSTTYDAFGLEDVGTSVEIQQGYPYNIVVGGYITNSNNKKELVILKYDFSGNLLWKHTQGSNDPSGDAALKKLTINPVDSSIYFIGGDKEVGANKRAIVGRMFPNGVKAWERYVTGNYDHLPSDIQYGGYGTPGIFAITIKDSTVNEYELSFYTEHQLDTAKLYASGGGAKCLARTLIVRLDTSALNFNKINDIEYRAGSINDFLKPAAVSSIQANLATVCENDRCDITVYKIFPYLTSSMNKTVSRLGDTVNIPQFYSALLFEFPSNVNIASAANSLNTLEPLVKYSHPDHFVTPNRANQENLQPMVPYAVDEQAKIATVNDPEYSVQRNLHSVVPYDSAHINVEPAWNFSTGKSFIKVGVFDSGIDWNHEDFGDGTSNGSKVIKGWSFENGGFDLKSVPNGDYNGHGTACAGLIGAIRNNSKGVAGIAGGNYNSSYPLDSSGVSLYGLQLYWTQQWPYSPFLNDTVGHYFYEAIVGTAMNNPNIPYGYGLHVMSNSWGFTNTNNNPYFTDTTITLLREAAHFANRCKVTFVAARGNNSAYPYNVTYPAILDDDWILTVGGTGTTGWYNSGLNFHEYGQFAETGLNRKDIDVSAPFTYTLNRVVLSSQNNTSYSYFAGTSASCPNVAGAVGLLLSYLNLPYAANSNLAPEDCEAILQMSASDCDYGSYPGYDTLTGFGRLNVGKAMQMVDKSKYKLSHYGTATNSSTRTRTAYPQTLVKLEERYQNFLGTWFSPKYYKLTPYKITATINHSLPVYDTIKAFWPRPSSSDLLDSIVNGKIYPRERVKIESMSLSNAVVSGYVYKVKDSLGTTDLGWWPYDTTGNGCTIAYSILRRDTTSAIGVKEEAQINNLVSIYPNPTNNTQILNVNTSESEPINIDLFDVTGRLILTVYSGKTNKGNANYTVNLSKFDCGVYFYRVRIREDEKVFKIIKQ